VAILPIWEVQVKRKLLKAVLTTSLSAIRRVADRKEVRVRVLYYWKVLGFLQRSAFSTGHGVYFPQFSAPKVLLNIA